MSTDGELLSKLEDHYRSHRACQREIAAALGCTQGHLSKVLGGKVPLSKKCRYALEQFLQLQAQPEETPLSTAERASRTQALGHKIMHNMQNLLTEIGSLCDSIGISAERLR